MRAPISLLPLAAACAAALLVYLQPKAHAEAVTREAQTEGEKRLLEWDLNRKFEPRKTTFSPAALTGSKTVPVSTFGTRSFVSGKAETHSFSTSEFLSTQAGAAQKSFTTNPAQVTAASAGNKTFNSGKTAQDLPQASLGGNASASQKSFSDGSRAYLGPEADKMKAQYTPATGPRGGVSTGHQLTVDEVREILNRSK